MKYGKNESKENERKKKSVSVFISELESNIQTAGYDDDLHEVQVASQLRRQAVR
jgi:hypothetical protein